LLGSSIPLDDLILRRKRCASRLLLDNQNSEDYMLCDEIIDTILECRLCRPGGLKIFSPGWAANHYERNVLVKAFDDMTITKFVIPLNCDAHWLLVTIDRPNKVVSYFDSASKKPRPAALRIMKDLIQLYASQLAGSYKHASVTCQRQDDSVSCGLFMIYALSD
jgi:hypothetical protein